MKIKTFAVIALMASFFMTACDDTTDTIGTSLIDISDSLDVKTDTFGIKSSSIAAGNVLSRSTTGYLGKIRDPETGAYITGDFMAQFSTLENYQFPTRDSLVSVEDGEVVADSCNIRLFYTDFYGDSLATMNLTAYEMSEAMNEGVNYYSNYNPIKEGLVRTNGIKVNKTYTLTDLSVSEDTRYSSSYTPNIKINLNKPYTDKSGKTYKNYGTYIMRKYYENPENFKNSYNFIHNVCPGFYFKVNDGLGSMAYVTISQLNVYFRYKSDSTLVGMSSFSGTEEVLQTTNITNDDGVIADMIANANDSTYLKTPAGIFTVLEIPVDSITKEHKKYNFTLRKYENTVVNHENDTINSAKVTLQRFNNNTQSEYSLDVPSTLLMIPLDSINTFFEQDKIADYKQSFLASYSSTSNSYTFNNIAGMINFMAANKANGTASENWNKVAIIPVSTTVDSSTSAVTKVVHDMSLTSTRLVRGKTFVPDGDIKITVIYSKFNQK